MQGNAAVGAKMDTAFFNLPLLYLFGHMAFVTEYLCGS